MGSVANLVQELTSTTGTGTVTLTAIPGFARFADRFTNGTTVHYVIEDGSNWEVGIGTVGAGHTLARTTVQETFVGGVLTVSGATAISISAGGAVVRCAASTQYLSSIPPVTSVAGKTGAVTLAVGDVSGAAAVGQTMYIGTTAVAINRASGAITLTGTSIDGNAGSVGGYSVGPNGTGPTWGSHIPHVASDGVTEIGLYLDFHNSSGDASDYAVRLSTGGTATDLYLNGSRLWRDGYDSPHFTGVPVVDSGTFQVGSTSGSSVRLRYDGWIAPGSAGSWPTYYQLMHSGNTPCIPVFVNGGTSYSMGATDKFVNVNAPSAGVVVTLPGANWASGRSTEVIVRRYDNSGFTVFVQPLSGQTLINTAGSSVGNVSCNGIGAVRRFVSDGGAVWYQLS